MSISFAPLFKIAWKLGLALAAFKCGFYIASHLGRAGTILRIRSFPPTVSRHVILQEQNVQLKAEIEDSKRSIKDLLDRLQHEKERAKHEVERLGQEIDFWRRMEGLARVGIQTRDEKLQQQQVLLAVHCDELRVLEARLLNVTSLTQDREQLHMQERAIREALLDRQRTELLNAHSYLSPVNTVSDSEVVQMLRSLNLEISRTATFLTESFRAEDRRDGEGITRAFERTKESVGPVIAELLESSRQQEDPILVHFALQASIASFSAGIISAWDFQHQSNSIFAGIYKQMLKSETQNIAGRWRALTRQYSKLRLYNGRDLSPGFIHQLADLLCNIMVLAGARIDTEQTLQLASENFQNIVHLALDIQRIIGEDITSCDLEILLVPGEEFFDPENMEDVYGGEILDDDGLPPVFCTSHLGLRRHEKAEADVGDDIHSTILLKPKVVLEAFVYELMGAEEEEDPDDTEDA